MGDHAPTTYYEALNRAIRAEIMLDRIDRERDSQIIYREDGQSLVSRDTTNQGTSKDRDRKGKRTFESKSHRRGERDKRSHREELTVC